MEDDPQLDTLLALLQGTSEVTDHYLLVHVFPTVLKHQQQKIAASGHDLGSDLIFGTRLGFSGTPSDLLPTSLGRCYYEPGSEAKIARTLSDSTVVKATLIDEWSINGLLDWIANAPQQFDALIDVGALITGEALSLVLFLLSTLTLSNITGLKNEEVAKYLLSAGLPHKEGVVYVDEKDRVMIVTRQDPRPLLLSRSGVKVEQRFTFYDQVRPPAHLDFRNGLTLF